MIRPEWRDYLLLYRRYWRRILLGLAAALGKGAALAYLALTLRSFLNSVVANGGMAGSWRNFFMAMLMALGSGLLAFLATQTTVTMTKPVVSGMRIQLIDRMLRMDPARVHAIGRGHLHNTMVREVERIDTMTQALLGLALPAFASILIMAALLVRISPIFGLGCIAVTGAIWVLSRYLRRRISPAIRRFQESGAEYSRGALLTLQRFDLARAFSAEPREVAERGVQVDALDRAGRATAWRIQSVGETHAALNNFALIGFVMAGAIAVNKSHGSYDLLVVFLILMLMRAQAGIIVATIPEIDAGGIALEKVFALIRETDHPPYTGQRVIDFAGAIRLEDVAFSYDGKPLIAKVDLTVSPGECVAICGANGTGKTTIINLMLGLLRPTAGRLTADGVAYDEIDMAALRRDIGFVPQSAGLFPGSIADNIAYARPDATRAEIAAAAALAGADGFIESMPEGYDSIIGEDGALVSGGQGQRIALARALLGRPKLLILDEPTNHLDTEAIARLLDVLRNLPEHPGIVLISHSDDVLDAADRLFVLEGGGLRPLTRTGRSAPAVAVKA